MEGIDCFDLDNDGVPELIAGWENGASTSGTMGFRVSGLGFRV